MVRKKANSSKNTSIFAPPGKVMMIQRNKLSTPLKTPISTPLKTPSSTPLKTATSTPLETQISSKKSISQCHVSSYNKSAHSRGTKSPRKRKVNQALRTLREIRKFQGSTKLLIPKAPFSRIVREIAQNIIKAEFKFTVLSLKALQEATEMAIVNLLEIANLCCLHAKRVTLTPADIRLTRRAFGVTNALNG